MSPRVGLNRALIAGAALELLHEQPEDALTMRRLAARLGVDPMALYRHVRDKQDLFGAMSDATLREGLADALDGAADATDLEQVVELMATAATAFYRHLMAHPERIPIVAAAPTTTAAATYSVAVASRLIDAGIDEATAVRSINTVVAYVLGAAVTTDSRNPPQPVAADVSAVVAELAANGLEIDPAMVHRVLAAGSQPEFELGLRAIIAGLLGD